MTFRTRLYLFRFCNSFTLIFPLYVAMFVDIGLSPTQISLCLTAWSVTTFLCQTFAGAAADRWSRRLVLAFGQVAFTGCFALWWAFPNFVGIFAGLVLWGLKSASTQGVFEALVYDELKAEGLAEDYLNVIGRARAVDSLGFLASAIGAAALTRYGYGPAIAGSLAAAVVGVFAALALPAAPKAVASDPIGYWRRLSLGLGEVRRRPAVLAVLVFAACVATVGPGLQEYWPVYGRGVGLGLPAISLIVCGQYIVEAVANLTAWRLRGLHAGWFFGAYAVMGLFLSAAAAVWAAPMMALLILYSGGMRLMDAVFEGRLQALIPTETRATIGAVKGLCTQIGMTSLFTLIGAVAQAASYRAAFGVIGALVILIGAGWLAGGWLRQKPSAA